MGVKLGNKNINSVIKEVIPKTYKLFDGSFDNEGLKQIGWNNHDIKFYNDTCVNWFKENNDLYKLTESELAGDDSAKTRFLPKNTTIRKFYNYKNLIGITELDTSNVTDMVDMFNNCKSLITIPQLDTSKVTSMNSMFKECESLITIPQLNTSNVTNMMYMFADCTSLTGIPQLNTSNVTNMNSMFTNCIKLITIPQLNTSKVTDMRYMFSSCGSLKTVPQLNTSKVTDMANMFSGCKSITTIPQLDTSNVTSMMYMFYICTSLTSVPLLDASKVIKMGMNIVNGCTSLTTLGGFANLGKAYLTTVNANYGNYLLDLSQATNLTHDSLMNVINNLYDIATKGCQLQQLRLGSTNLEKLTAEEIAIATNKGWTVS